MAALFDMLNVPQEERLTMTETFQEMDAMFLNTHAEKQKENKKGT